MNNLSEYITEKLVINKDIKINDKDYLISYVENILYDMKFSNELFKITTKNIYPSFGIIITWRPNTFNPSDLFEEAFYNIRKKVEKNDIFTLRSSYIDHKTNSMTFSFS